MNYYGKILYLLRPIFPVLFINPFAFTLANNIKNNLEFIICSLINNQMHIELSLPRIINCHMNMDVITDHYLNIL